MIVVVAPRLDPAGQDLVESWAAFGAALLGAEDLTSPGWVFDVADPGTGTAVVEGRAVPVEAICGVVTRRPAVLAEELRVISADDREYVAAEVNAFLLAWLAALPCAVVNRPTATSLCGPAWSPLRWAATARRAGVPWNGEVAASGRDVVVCGAQVVGAVAGWEAPAARALARAAGASLLGLRVVDGAFAGASVMPSLADPEVRDAMLALLDVHPAGLRA